MSKDQELFFADFDDEKPVKSVSKPVEDAWKEEVDSSEAVCVICDALFTPTHGRPPILCPTCKTGLHELLQKDTGL